MKARDIGANIRRELFRQEQTAVWLAERLQYPGGARALRRRLRGEVEFTGTELVDVARVLGVSVDHLTREDEK